MKKHIIRILAIALSLVFWLGTFGCSHLSDDVYNDDNGGSVGVLSSGDPSHGSISDDASGGYSAPQSARTHKDVTYDEMRFVQPDTAAIAAALDDLTARLEAGEPLDTFLPDYDKLIKHFNDARAMYDLAYLQYAFDVTDDALRQTQLTLDSELTELAANLTDLSEALLNSSDTARSRLTEVYGDPFVRYIERSAALSDKALIDLLDEENELIARFDALSSSLTVPYNGDDLTYPEIYAIEDYDTYHELRTAFLKVLNLEAGRIFLELLDVRCEIAEVLGYSGYADYGYDVYSRDFTPADSRALHAAVKEYLVPIFVSYKSDIDERRALYRFSKDEDTYLAELRSAVHDLSPDLGESMDFLLRNRLYDTSSSQEKMNTTFTTYIGGYDVPFLFAQQHESYPNITAFIHEFGHFSNFYHMGGDTWGYSSSLDLAEIDSQGLELLIMPYYHSIFGDLADAATRDRLYYALYTILESCLGDEFQQEVYAHPDMTLDEMNRLYARLSDEYGFVEVFEYTGVEWTTISHTFQLPLYYISYGVSMIPAVELFVQMQSDPADAVDTYLAIHHRELTASYAETLRSVGLADPFDPSAIRRIADMMREMLLIDDPLFYQKAA